MTITDLHPTGGPDSPTQLRGPASRWQPTRAGLLNVWQYLEETFEFTNGRLVLFGPNGSGKTMALELLYPYLLDANASPSRLSTAGGNDRGGLWDRVSGYSEATSGRVGYLWIEFMRTTTAGHLEHLTCGCRLETRAKGGKHHWFTTKQKVGFDLELMGPGRVPLDSAALKAAIGDHGNVWGSDASAYRTAVRTTLYPGFSDEQYRALIDGLLAVRKQSITDGLTDSKLNELLTNGLPALDPNELEYIAKGFEQLDARRAAIEELEGVVTAGAALARRVRTYSRSALRAAAAAVSAAETEFDDVTKKRNAAQTRHDKAVEEAATAGTGLEAEKDKESTLRGRIEGIKASEQYRSLDEIDARRKTAERSEAQAIRDRNQATTQHNSARDAADEAAESLGLAQDEDRRVDELDRQITTLGRELGLDIDRAEDPRTTAARWSAAADTRLVAVEDVRSRLDAHGRAVSHRHIAQTNLEGAETALEDARRRHKQAANHETDTSKGWVAAVDAWADELVELPVDRPTLAETTAAAALDAYQQLVNDAHGHAQLQLTRVDDALVRAVEELTEDRGVLDRERVQLEDTAHTIEPEPAPWRGPRDHRRVGAPLWRVVDARPDVEDLAGLEAALAAAGLLDLFIACEGDTGPTMGDTTAATVSAAAGPTLLDHLIVDTEASRAAGLDLAAVEGVLRSVSVTADRDATGQLTICCDGFAYGPVTGATTGTAARFIGATARERARLDRLEVVRAELARIDERVGDLGQQRQAIARRLGVATAERAAAPAVAAIREAHDDTVRAHDRMEDAETEVGRIQGEVAAAEAKVREETLTLNRVASAHGLPTDHGALRQIESRITNLKSESSNLTARAESAAIKHATATREATFAAKRADEAAEAAEVAATSARTAAEDRGLLDELEARVGQDARSKVEELRTIESELHGVEITIDTLQKRLRALDREQGEAQGALAELEGKTELARDVRDRTDRSLLTLLGAEVHLDAEIGIDEDDLASHAAVLRAARGINQAVPAAPDTQRLTTELLNIEDERHRLQSILGGRAQITVGPLADCPDYSRTVASVEGADMRVGTMIDRFAGELQRARDEIEASTAKLFEDAFTGSLRLHLASRLRAARRLVDGMNTLLAGIRTASGGVAVSLKWDVADDNTDAETLTEVKKLLLRDHHSDSEREFLFGFLADRIDQVRHDDQTSATWRDALEALFDYRHWHRFRLLVRHDRFGETWVPFNSRRVSLSAGEKSLVLSLPLFAAVASHYMPRDEGGEAPPCPRFLLLDEVFPKNDRPNKRQILRLLVDLDLDCVLTSDKDMCDYDTIDGIAIAVVSKDGENSFATRLVWNGQELAPIAADTGQGQAQLL